MLTCGHLEDGADSLPICEHLFENKDGDDRLLPYHRFFTGNGIESRFLCAQCEQEAERREPPLRLACSECFDEALGQNGTCLGFGGAPGFLQRQTSLRFAHERVELTAPLRGRILDVQPISSASTSQWVTLTTDGVLYTLDLDGGTSTLLARVEMPLEYTPEYDSAHLQREKLSLYLSPGGDTAAVVQNYGLHGSMIDLADGRELMRLGRENHCAWASPFPLAFVEREGRTLLIHGTSWNRLDISDPRTGELLTPRQVVRTEHVTAEHYLEYFHFRLAPSPEGGWIAEDGWVWHPIGMVVTWSLDRWLQQNVWESEDGPSRKRLVTRVEWDQPLCWLDDRRLAVWGSGEGEPVCSNGALGWGENPAFVPAVRIFDVVSGEEVRWFAGPRGALFFDEHLFSCSGVIGTAVWDAATGERLHHDPTCRPTRYHRGTKQFLTVLPNGVFQLSRLLPH
jgi:hypothetical protein